MQTEKTNGKKEKSSKGFTIFKSEPVARVLESHPKSGVSSRISQVADRYSHILLESMPDLAGLDVEVFKKTLAYYDLLIVSENGEYSTNGFIPPRAVEQLQAYFISDQSLFDRIQKMTIPQRYALLEKLGF